MEQRIKRSELKVGMYVLSYGLGSFESPLVQINKPMLTPEAIVELVPADVDSVLVDTTINIGLLGQERAVGVPITTSLVDELPLAKRLYSEALTHVHGFVDDVRKGKDFDYRDSDPLVDNFIESVFRNETASATLFKLKWFDEYTYTHSINVSILAIILGKHLGLKTDELHALGIAGLYHDAGKARIPEAILNKPGKLTEQEFQIMKTHPLEGYKLMQNQPGLDPEILRAVVEHHERFDGTGYPRGLDEAGIGRYSRIISVVDVYDALTSRRVYKEPIPPAKALGMMYQWRDRDFPPQAIENFIRCMGVFPVGSLVRLTNGEYGIVASANLARPTKPEIKVVLDSKRRPQLPRVLDLEALADTPEAVDIAEIMNPAALKIDLERFFFS